MICIIHNVPHTLRAHQLQKSYRSRQVVKDVSLEVHSGEIIGLLGPNGAGKTTSFYLMVGLTRADRGQVLIDDEDITHAPMYQRARLGLGYLPQEASVFRQLSVENNILAILELKRHLSRAQRQHRLEQLLSELGITHLRRDRGLSLSGGERRRVEIARALATDPKFILLDEPFAGVDPISIQDIKDIVSFLKQQQLGVLITDHNVRETLDICERAYIVHQGILIAEGTPAQILAHPQVQQTYLGSNFKL